MLKMEEGMEPESLLYSRFIISNEDMLDRDGGMPPVKLLLFRDKFWSFDNSPIHDEISPLKLLNPTEKCCNRKRWDNSLGKEAWKPLFSMLRITRNERFPTCRGMVPTMFM
jgi:hypothetical protein